MLPIKIDTVRLVLHLLGVSVWVGGQIVVGGIVPMLRKRAPELLPAVAQQFQKIAWPGFALAFATGIWNIIARDTENATTEWWISLSAKFGLVVLSGIFAALHSWLVGPSIKQLTDEEQITKRKALSGALAGMALATALGAVVFGVQLSNQL